MGTRDRKRNPTIRIYVEKYKKSDKNMVKEGSKNGSRTQRGPIIIRTKKSRILSKTPRTQSNKNG